MLEILKITNTLAQAKGKNIRPALAHLMATACDETKADEFRPGIAVEAFHLFALIHDDIIDRGAVRRGAPTIHHAIEETYRAAQRHGDKEHLANSQAILAGDLVYTWVFQLLFALKEEPFGSDLASLFFDMVHETVAGQMIDVDLMSQHSATESRIYDKMYFKTASYTFIRPLQFGAAVGGRADTETLHACVAVGKPLGLAFQIQDDVIDVMTPSDESGKQPFADILDGQHTYITNFIRHQGTTAEHALLESTIATKQVNPETFREMLVSSGAIEDSETRAATYFAEARAALETAPLPDLAKHELEKLTTHLEHRTV